MSAGRFWSRPVVRRVTEITITTAFWFAWAYLILPLVNLLMWLLGVRLFVDEMLVRGGHVALLAELRNYGLVILGMAVVMLLWIAWNRRRYGMRNQRVHQPHPLTTMEQAAQAGVSPDQLDTLQTARRVVLDFDDQDRLQIRR